MQLARKENNQLLQETTDKNQLLPNNLHVNDVWRFDSEDLEPFMSLYKKWDRQAAMSFSIIRNEHIRNKIKEFTYLSLINKHLTLRTLADYFRDTRLTVFNDFLSVNGLLNIDYQHLLNMKLELQYEDFLKVKNLSLKEPYRFIFFRQIPKYIFTIKSIKHSDDNDIWDVRQIDSTKISSHRSDYKLNFTQIKSLSLKNTVKKYIRYRLTTLKQSTCANDLRVNTHFVNYLSDKHIAIKNIERKDIEEYIYLIQYEKLDLKNFLLSIKSFLKYLQLSENEQASFKMIESLIFNEDYPKGKVKGDNSIKYIQDDILEQLENNLEYLTPIKYIPVVILLRASGWRISDVLNLRYDTCLTKVNGGYFLCGDIQKTLVLEHRIPISDEIALVIKECIKIAENNSWNTNRYLFISDGKRKGSPYSSENIQDCLNRFAKKQNILDENGKVFRFKTHAFRHTKAVELINNGMNLLHVQKWLAHLTPVMTLHYAKLLDTTMRKSWEDATKDGLFKLDGTGNASKVDIANIEDEDIIEWEWIKHNLDAVRMPLGYCMKPNKMECATQLNPCLTCRSLCTTPEFIPSFMQEIQQTKEIINKGKSQNRTFWVEKNELLLDKLTSVLTVLESGKIKHDAGKSGREYVGEQRNKI